MEIKAIKTQRGIILSLHYENEPEFKTATLDKNILSTDWINRKEYKISMLNNARRIYNEYPNLWQSYKESGYVVENEENSFTVLN